MGMILKQSKTLLPGTCVAGILAFAASILSQYSAVPVMLLCLLLGMAWRAVVRMEQLSAGVDFTARTILRFGVILIGARLSFEHFLALGWELAAFIVVATVFMIAFAVLCARLLKLDKELGFLIGGGTAICGVSAVLALSSLMPRTKTLDEHTVSAVIAVTLMGSVLMIAYPLFGHYLGLEDGQLGFVIGGTIHDVSQAVAAGYSVSETAGDSAILVKLIRVFLLVPVLVVFSLLMGRGEHGGKSLTASFPWFVVGFLVLVLVNSTGYLPAFFAGTLPEISKVCLIMAVTAVGMKTSVPTLLSLGWRPFSLVFFETLILFGFYVAIV